MRERKNATLGLLALLHMTEGPSPLLDPPQPRKPSGKNRDKAKAARKQRLKARKRK